MEGNRILTCIYCGHEYPQDTPAWGDQILTDHIKVCEKHPMRKLEADKNKLREALVRLVGSDDRQELENMKGTISLLPCSEEDKNNTINAINVLLEVE
jgi:hypothetical protein